MNYYFLGIGGIGMSALARFFHRRGDTVSGYDRTPSPLTAELEAEGIAVHYDDAPDRLPAAIDLAIYTPAIPDELGEMQALKSRGVRLEKRSQVLGELTRGKRCIAVAGSHGKTTTSTLIAHLLTGAPCGCSAFLGGISKNFNSNLVVNPDSEYVVVEADEYDRSFLQLHPHIAVITATDPDHLDIYGTHEHMLEAYLQFANQVDSDGALILKENIFRTLDGEPFVEYGHEHHHDHHDDDAHSAHSAHLTNPNIHTYTARGIEADYYAINVRNYNGNIFFDLRTPNGVLFDLELDGAPLVNVENAVAASAVALSCGVDQFQLRSGLKSFAGVRRRFDYRIREKNLVYIDDYAHHPNEIEQSVKSVRELYKDKKIAAIFQPHLYTRTRDFYKEFAEALSLLDEVVLTEIYPAREEPIEGVTSQLIYDNLREGVEKKMISKDEVLNYVKSHHFEVLIVLGAGDLDNLVPKITRLLNSKKC